MAETAPENHHCPPNRHCVNVERVERRVETVETKLSGEDTLLSSKLEDLRLVLSTLPRDIADAIKREREEAAEKFKRGSSHFAALYKRLDRLERAVMILWVIVGLLGLGKTAMLLWPMVEKLFP